MWLGRLRIQRCPCSGSGGCCDAAWISAADADKIIRSDSRREAFPGGGGGHRGPGVTRSAGSQRLNPSHSGDLSCYSDARSLTCCATRELLV